MKIIEKQRIVIKALVEDYIMAEVYDEDGISVTTLPAEIFEDPQPGDLYEITTYAEVGRIVNEFKKIVKENNCNTQSTE